MLKFTSISSRFSSTAARYLAVWLVLALLAPWLANDIPLVVKHKRTWLFPAFTLKKGYTLSDGTQLPIQQTDWKQLAADIKIFPLIPYAPGKSDLPNSNYKGPFDPQFDSNRQPLHWTKRHWLGTNKLGDDVLAGIIHGARTSFYIGCMAIALAGLMGISLGLLAGYVGNSGIFVRVIPAGLALCVGILGTYIVYFQLDRLQYFSTENSQFAPAWSLCILLLIPFIYSILSKIPSPKIPLPIDAWVQRLMQFFTAIPKILLLVILAAYIGPSVHFTAFIIGCISWTGIARITRAETLRIREMDFIQAAKTLGLSEFRIVSKHIFPILWAPLSVSLMLGWGNAILAESSLSFLGIGVPDNVITWGNLIQSGREKLQAWWLIIFPAIALFSTLYALFQLSRTNKSISISSSW